MLFFDVFMQKCMKTYVLLIFKQKISNFEVFVKKTINMSFLGTKHKQCKNT